MVVGCIVGFVVGLVVGCMIGGVVGVVYEGGFGASTTATGVGGFVAGEGLAVFGVGVVVDAKASPILPIAINTADKVSDVLMGGFSCCHQWCVLVHTLPYFHPQASFVECGV